MILSQKKIEDEGIKIVHAFSPIQINKVILEMPESSGKLFLGLFIYMGAVAFIEIDIFWKYQACVST